MPIARNSFIQLTKLSNVKGRITYISSHAKQENLYAVYETTERKFWRELAKCNQEEFAKSGYHVIINASKSEVELNDTFNEFIDKEVILCSQDNTNTESRMSLLYSLEIIIMYYCIYFTY